MKTTISGNLKPFEARVHFPTYPNNTQPLRTQFDHDVKRPSIVTISKRIAGRLRLVQAVLPRAAIRGRS